MKDIINYNSKGLTYGYQEWYWDNKLWVRGNRKNGDKIGYEEFHGINNLGKITIFYIK